ncbi:unnamed protein product, partial [Closterium sp. NIES-53]
DAAESNEDLGMVDKVVRTVATLLGNSSVWSQRFNYLQRVIYQTNLEVQGIHTVRWLSRGDAVCRLCKVLGACIVLLWEHNHKAYEIMMCYKFHFCLFSLADILADMNDLNRCFQRRESTTGDLTERYLTTNKPFGGEGKSWLVNFLKVHKEGGGKQVRVRGVDGEGRPINHLYTMHERKLKGHKQGSTYADCEMAQPHHAVAGAGCASPLHCGVREGVLQAEHHQVLGAWSALQRASGGADADIAPERGRGRRSRRRVKLWLLELQGRTRTRGRRRRRTMKWNRTWATIRRSWKRRTTLSCKTMRM